MPSGKAMALFPSQMSICIILLLFCWNKNTQSNLKLSNGDITLQILDSAHNLLFIKWLNILGTGERVGRHLLRFLPWRTKKSRLKNWGSTNEELKLIKQKGKFIVLIPPKETRNPIQWFRWKSKVTYLLHTYVSVLYGGKWNLQEKVRDIRKKQKLPGPSDLPWCLLTSLLIRGIYYIYAKFPN